MRGATKILEAQHRSGDAFDGPMVLLDHVTQVLDLTDRDGRLPLGVSRVQRSRLEPFLSMVIVSGTPFLAVDFSNKRRAANLSRLALNRKSIVLPALSTPR